MKKNPALEEWNLARERLMMIVIIESYMGNVLISGKVAHIKADYIMDLDTHLVQTTFIPGNNHRNNHGGS